jgi:hypothetical protein
MAQNTVATRKEMTAVESTTGQAIRPDAVFRLLGMNFNLALNALEGGGFPRLGLWVRNGTIH